MNPMWVWIRWYLGEGEFKPYGPRNPDARPPVPKRIPAAWWERMVRLLAQRRKLHSRTPPHDDVLAFWRRMSCWVTRIDHFPAEWLPTYGGEQYRLVIVPTLYGVDREDHTEDLLGWVKNAQAYGYKVCGSQWGQAHDVAEAEREAEAAVRAVAEFGFDGWVMNGEKLYEWGGKSGAYVKRFRLRKPAIPLGWSPEPRLALDHRVLQENSVCYMPQAYPLENGWDVQRSVLQGRAFGYEAKNIVPLIAAYETSGQRWAAWMYRDQAKDHGIPGLCLYTANQAADVPQYWRELVV